MEDITKIALEKAMLILSSECSPIGLMASPEGYPHVWARDSVITSLGALLSPGHEICLQSLPADAGGPAVRTGRHPQQRERRYRPVGSHQRRLGGFQLVVHPRSSIPISL